MVIKIGDFEWVNPEHVVSVARQNGSSRAEIRLSDGKFLRSNWTVAEAAQALGVGQ